MFHKAEEFDARCAMAECALYLHACGEQTATETRAQILQQYNFEFLEDRDHYWLCWDLTGNAEVRLDF